MWASQSPSNLWEGRAAERALNCNRRELIDGTFVGSGTKSCDAWLAKARSDYPGVPVVASPLDRWPDSLREDPSVRWLHPGLMKRLYSLCQPWNLQRKLHRALLFSYLHRHRVSAVDAAAAVLDFELRAAYHLIDQPASYKSVET